MDARERSFLEEAQRYHASGGDLDALVDVYCVGATVSITDLPHYGCTRLYHAAQEGWCSALKVLLDQGADVHVGYAGTKRSTPLHTAARYDRLDAAVLLLDAGARVDHRDHGGLTPLHIAGRTDMCQLLLSRGAPLDARSTPLDAVGISGRDPEAYARSLGHTTAADFLAAVRAAGGWRAYCDAQRRKFLDLRRELLAPGAVAESSIRLYERVFVELPNAVFPRVLAFF